MTYFATIGDPPAVRIFKHAFAVIVAYADTLTAFSDGSNAAALQGQISELADAVDSLGAALAFVPGPIAGVAALAPVVNKELKPVIQQALLEQSREDARKFVLRTAPAMQDLIEALRDAAPAMLDTLTTKPAAELEAAAIARRKDERPVTVAAAYVTQIANYVVLLGQLRDAFDALVLAYEEPQNPVNLALVVKRSNELATDVQAFQKAWSDIRNRL